MSYKDKELKQEIEKLVGKSFGIKTIWKLKGVGSPKFRIREASRSFIPYLPKIVHGEYCNIELRPSGIILRFRYHLDNMGWIIPFHHLSIYKSGDYYTIHGAGEYLKVDKAHSNVNLDGFMDKMLKLKAERSPEEI